jgi:hypothetical protein
MATTTTVDRATRDLLRRELIGELVYETLTGLELIDRLRGELDDQIAAVA